MHIKQVTISGFRSFKHLSDTEPFSARHNVIVGRNGSGKSNFFDAIQFVLLSPKFYNLRQEQRQQLLHEGAGANVMSAYVEIVFDNSDGRLTVEGDEVVLRRTIGLKKDEVFLNRRRATKQEVTALLESAGFSKSNPYYIVQQGKVNALCLMKDDERINLLKEVAGTRVYEERRSESLKIMEETNQKREKIQEMIGYIEQRLQELEEETVELREYQDLDKSKRALEFTLYEKELKQADEELLKIYETREELSREKTELYDSARIIHDDIRSTEQKLSLIIDDIKELEEQRTKINKQKFQCIDKQSKLEIQERGLKEKFKYNFSEKQIKEQQLRNINNEIVQKERELHELMPSYQIARDRLKDARAQLETCKREIDQLYAKQGRGSRFQSVEERDAFLNREISKLSQTIRDKTALIRQMETKSQDLHQDIAKYKNDIQMKDRQIEEARAQLEKISSEIQEYTKRKEEKHEERKLCWQKAEKFRDDLKQWRQKYNESCRSLQSAIPRHIYSGLEAIKQIVQRENIRGYYGSVMENFQLQGEHFRTCVEVAAGNALFHVIVDTDETAAALLKKLEKDQLGRVTFMPLNKLRVKDVRYPSSPEVVPLIQQAIRFEPEVELAMKQIFGRILLARNLEVATAFSVRENLDAVTLEGDFVDRKGALEGGFHDQAPSPIRAFVEIVEAETKIQQIEAQFEKAEKEAQQVDQQTTNVMGNIQKFEAERGKVRHDIDNSKREIKLLKQRLQTMQNTLNTQSEDKPKFEAEIESFIVQRTVLENELGTVLVATLSTEERQQLNYFLDQIPFLEAQVEASLSEFGAVEEQQQRYHAVLHGNLLKQKEELENNLFLYETNTSEEIDANAIQEQLEEKQAQLRELTQEVNAVEVQIERLNLKIEQTIKNQQVLSAELDQLKARDSQVEKELEEKAKSLENLLNKKQIFTKKKTENEQKIRQLGSVPSAELKQHQEYNIKQLMKALHKCNEKLKGYSHVNKKALDQYTSFSQQRELLLERKRELDDGANAITELIAKLDQQKDEAILRTFKGVSHHFTEVFHELVPEGVGELILRTSLDQDEDEASGAQSNRVVSVNEFKGVQIKVSFRGADQRYLMQQLSGGQKALVALALIFAIQRCDPAPFYLFDEIDQALDSTHRASIAALIHNQANTEENGAQFITSTFRPELVKVADKCYGISHQMKVSSLHVLDKEQALQFVANIMIEEGVIGKEQETRGSNEQNRIEVSEEKNDDVEEEEEEEDNGNNDDDEL